jgi:hypothetical protein
MRSPELTRDLLDMAADGWVPIQSGEATNTAHREAFDETSQTVRDAKSADGQSMSEGDLRATWPFDLG